MPIQCKMINPDEIKPKDRKPGDMFYADWLVDETGKVHGVSKEYERDWKGKRPPITVILPNRRSFMPDQPFNGDLERKVGWVVTGQPPNITVSPSINCIPNDYNQGYHGWLQNGILSDDIEGRKY